MTRQKTRYRSLSIHVADVLRVMDVGEWMPLTKIVARVQDMIAPENAVRMFLTCWGRGNGTACNVPMERQIAVGKRYAVYRVMLNCGISHYVDVRKQTENNYRLTKKGAQRREVVADKGR